MVKPSDKRSKRLILTCKVVESRNDEASDFVRIGDKIEIINPFGERGSGNNDPENIMIMKWLRTYGAIYTFDHKGFYSISAPPIYKEKFINDNEIKIISSCGQTSRFDLDITEDQDITEVTIRGVKYVKARC